MWQRFTDDARQVMYAAQEEAIRCGGLWVGPEHLLLSIAASRETRAARLLVALGIDLDEMARDAGAALPNTSGNDGAAGAPSIGANVAAILDAAAAEAQRMGSESLGTEHILVALAERGGESVVRALRVDAERLRAGVQAGLATEAAAPRADVERARRLVRLDSLRLRGRSLLSMAELDADQLAGVLDVAEAFAAVRRTSERIVAWDRPRCLACLFEKPSLRTRVTFELGMKLMGGEVVILGPTEIGLGTREPVPDAARNLERWVDVIMARVMRHETLVGLRDHARVPVINGLCDREHPCQALADLLTLRQRFGALDGLRVAWVGDGNNVLHSLLYAAALSGMSLTAACPAGYEPDQGILMSARKLSRGDARLEVVREPEAACAGAHAVVTDVWTSMGQEAEREERLRRFAGYQVTAALMDRAHEDAVFLHCLPAHRGEEVAADVIDGPRSAVFDQAENRMYAQQAVLALVL